MLKRIITIFILHNNFNLDNLLGLESVSTLKTIYLIKSLNYKFYKS